jgi:16S rRNA processing protein RimM
LDADRRSLSDDEFWQTDLVGCSVVLADGSDVGHVTGIVESPAQDILVLDTPRGERMIPLVKELVPTVDVAARRIVVDPPQGLLD